MFTDRDRDFNKEKSHFILDEDEVCSDAPQRTIEASRDSEPPSSQSPRSYESETDRAALERSFERERQLSEFKRDRDFIILSIQAALKSRNYREAQELVFQYRLAAEIDGEFRRLAQLTKSVCLEHSVADDILLILDSTPDDDYVKRYMLYERLLAIEPNNQSYKKAHKLLQKELKLDAPLAKPLKMTAYWIGFVFSTLMIIGTFSELASLNAASVLYALFSLTALFFIFPPQWVNFHKKYPAFFNGGTFFIINFIIFMLTGIMGQ